MAQLVRITGPAPPSPLLSPAVLKNLRKSGLDALSSISSYQNQIIPIIQSKRDLMVCKFKPDPAAYLIPIISEIEENVQTSSSNNNNDSSVSPHCLILSPTIRYMNHIKSVAEKITGEGEGLKTLALNKRSLTEEMKEEVKKGCHILVATPQRLLQLIKEKLINCTEVKVVVMEEAYILLDLLDDPFVMAEIMGEFPDRDHRQTLVFSKCLPDEVQDIIGWYLKNDYLFASVAEWRIDPTEAALKDMTLEDMELDTELESVNQQLDLHEAQESRCLEILAENIKQQEALLASNEGKLQARMVGAEPGSGIWDLGGLTREMNLIELMSKKQDLQTEIEEVRKKIRGLEGEVQELEIEKSKLSDYISELEYRVRS